MRAAGGGSSVRSMRPASSRRGHAVDVAIRETVQVPARAGTRCAMQARGVGQPAVIVEAVIQGAVDHGVEPPVVAGEVGGVGDSEAHRYSGLGRPAAGLLDGGRGTIEAGHRVSARGQEDRVVTQPAADVEHLAGDAAERLEFHQLGLRLMNIPRDLRRFGTSVIGGLSAVEPVERAECSGTRHPHQRTREWPRFWGIPLGGRFVAGNGDAF